MGKRALVIVAEIACLGGRVVGEHVALVGATAEVGYATEGQAVSHRRHPGLGMKDLVLSIGLVH